MSLLINRLEKYGNLFLVNKKRRFREIGEISYADKEVCFEFAYEMAYGSGEHRPFRSGGTKTRKAGEIFINAFQGKLAEYAICRIIQSNQIEINDPDTNIYGRGKWDSFDLEINNIHIAIKSTKFYGDLLLLETKDWNRSGEYIPNDGGINANIYDIIVLVRLDPDGERIMKDNRLLYSSSANKYILKRIICDTRWGFDIAGFIIYEDLLKIIRENYVIPKGAKLNGSVKMDAENYYIQSGDMREGKYLIDELLKFF